MIRKRDKKSPKSTRAQRRESRDFHPLAGMLPIDVRKRGLYVQIYACAGDIPVWSGAHYMPEISARAVYSIESHWRRWRRWYDNLPANKARHYPAKEGPRAANCLVVFPVSDPQSRTIYRLKGA